MNKPLRIDPPAGYNEHIVHRILYDRDPLLKRLCDKVAVRGIIRERVGEDFLVPLLGVWSDPADIPWHALPDQFVLKPSHASGLVAIVREAANHDPALLAKQAREWLQYDYFDQSLEWGYRNVPRRILAERLLLGADDELPVEALVVTFGGKAAMIRIHTGAKSTPDRRDNWFDINGVRLPFHSLHFERGDYHLDPDMARRLVTVAEKVSAGFSHLRVDFYLTKDGLRIGELTPYHGSGLNPWSGSGCNAYFGWLWRNPDQIADVAGLHRAIAEA
ncbi:ATP-grasp fold amidoligase family protein [Kaistia terrae]|uniref:ATP-grasp fold amidoligase family protein n=1 Tax=Kaistia terrae TaxID=537017 RepID=A0ABW0Q624_9HYPH|nr:ATP-grasp fold amidoligase family protein [Kaistia terrae]MCX5578934.1 ATP-grasp fold amidoligase family protein [Kaistia terrae]